MIVNANDMDFNQYSGALVRGEPHDALAAVRAQEMQAGDEPVFTVVIPFYNEAAYIERTLQSLFAQSERSFRLLLVDNGSTDNGASICRALTKSQAWANAEIISEPNPGKIQALSSACARLETPYVAFCDADTIYPPHYLRRAREIFREGGPSVAAVMAVGITAAPHSLNGLLARYKTAIVGWLLARQCHTGGFGQIFRTDALLKIGGYASALWPYVLEDHEIIQRVLKVGACRYDSQLWCAPSTRRAGRRSASWTIVERFVYHLTPFALKDWYFRRFLAPRLRRRGRLNTALRDQPWAEKKLEPVIDHVLVAANGGALIEASAPSEQGTRARGVVAAFTDRIGFAIILGGVLLATRNYWRPADGQRRSHLRREKARHWRSIGH